MTAPSPREIRVHGVGGPQAPKILGVLDESETETLIPQGAPSELFRDGKSRLVRRIGEPSIVAYEWGGLTLGSLTNALWVVYLPLTMLNVAGWSHARGAGRWNRAVARTQCALGTLTYVGWIGHLLLDVIGRQWRDRLVLAELPGWLTGAIRSVGLPLAHLLFFAILGVLWWVNRRRGASFECAVGGAEAPTWSDRENVSDPLFFAHRPSYVRLRAGHELVAVTAAVAVVLLGGISRNLAGTGVLTTLTSIGVGLVVVAALQGVMLVVMWLTVRWLGSVPQAILATVGTVLCHAAFAGLGILAVERLGAWPKIEPSTRPIVAGPELGFADFFFVALAAAVVLLAGFAIVVIVRKPAPAGYPYGRPGLLTVLVGSANTLGALVALSFMGTLVALVVVQAGDLGLDGPSTWWASFIRWYEGYKAGQNAAQELGGLAMAGIPLAALAVLRRPRSGAVARIVGNVWDVLTFWPRRFHPFGVPPYAERAVPELRWMIGQYRQPDRQLTVAGHSQGSVLSFAALGQELTAPQGAGPVSLVSFGSPLGHLHGQAFPAYFGGPERSSMAERVARSGGRWWNLYRSTDAISGPVGDGEPAATVQWFDKCLPDPRGTEVPNDPASPPLERARPWYARNGHSFYLADPATRRMLRWLRDHETVTLERLQER